MTNTGQRTAIYLRVARQDQIAIEAQENQCMQYIEKKGYSFAASYIDNGQAATSGNQRDAFNKLTADAQKGLFDKVVVVNYSRIARNAAEMRAFFAKMEQCGVAVESIIEQGGAMI